MCSLIIPLTSVFSQIAQVLGEVFDKQRRRSLTDRHLTIERFEDGRCLSRFRDLSAECSKYCSGIKIQQDTGPIQRRLRSTLLSTNKIQVIGSCPSILGDILETIDMDWISARATAQFFPILDFHSADEGSKILIFHGRRLLGDNKTRHTP